MAKHGNGKRNDCNFRLFIGPSPFLLGFETTSGGEGEVEAI